MWIFLFHLPSLLSHIWIRLHLSPKYPLIIYRQININTHTNTSRSSSQTSVHGCLFTYPWTPGNTAEKYFNILVFTATKIELASHNTLFFQNNVRDLSHLVCRFLIIQTGSVDWPTEAPSLPPSLQEHTSKPCLGREKHCVPSMTTPIENLQNAKRITLPPHWWSTPRRRNILFEKW